MQIKPEQLTAKLQQNTAAMVWISGDEPLLMQEACDKVRKHAREQGFSEREVLEAAANFDWNQLLSANNSLSLFSERKLIDLRIGNNKPDEPAREALLAYLNNPNPDNLLLLTSGKLDKAAQSTRWFKSLESKALFCQIWPISEQQLPQWIQQRLHNHGLSADPAAVRLLAERVEGNMLAAAQEIDKLRLLVSGERLEVKTVMAAVADSSRFNVFTLVDACLSGQPARALRILDHLRAEGEEVLWVLNRLCNEIRNLSSMLVDLDKGQLLPAVLQGRGVWNARVPLVSAALKRHNQDSLLQLLDKARVVDQSVKGLLTRCPWDELADIVLGLSDPRLLVSVV
jgi:DNA polymerase III subunit delta